MEVTLGYDGLHSLAPGSAWGVVEGGERGRATSWTVGDTTVRARRELNDVASRGGDSEKPWWAEQARGMRCERCVVP
jgi:hypothetical protein